MARIAYLVKEREKEKLMRTTRRRRVEEELQKKIFIFYVLELPNPVHLYIFLKIITSLIKFKVISCLYFCCLNMASSNQQMSVSDVLFNYRFSDTLA